MKEDKRSVGEMRELVEIVYIGAHQTVSAVLARPLVTKKL